MHPEDLQNGGKDKGEERKGGEEERRRQRSGRNGGGGGGGGEGGDVRREWEGEGSPGVGAPPSNSHPPPEPPKHKVNYSLFPFLQISFSSISWSTSLSKPSFLFVLVSSLSTFLNYHHLPHLFHLW